MKKKRYRSNAAKGIWLILEHLAAAAAVGCAIFLIYIFTQGVNPLERTDKFENTARFGNELFETSWQILRNIKNIDVFSGTEDRSEPAAIDLDEVLNDSELTYRNTSGLAYTAEDLKEWGESSWEYGPGPFSDGENIVICEVGDGTYDYYYYRDFVKLLDNKTLSFDLDETYFTGFDSERTKEEVLEDVKERLQYGELEEGTSRWGINGIVDENDGEEIYLDISNYTGNSISEKFKPLGADSILEVLNAQPEWNGRIDEAFEALDAAIRMAADYENAWDNVKKYQKETSNVTYYYIDKNTDRIYTNRSEYEDSAKYNTVLREMKSAGAYMIIQPEFSECETNLAYLEEGSSFGNGIEMADWQRMIQEHSPSENYVFAVNVDLTYPVKDNFTEMKEAYEKYSPLCLPLAAGFVVAVLLFLVGLVWLTAAAGRRPEDEEIHLCFFDGWFTEIAAAAVAAAWIPGILVLEFGIEFSNQWQNGQKWQVYCAVGTLFGIYTAFCFLVGYLSLVRRIKARTLWKGSLLHWLFGWIKRCFRKIRRFFELYARNTRSKIKLTIGVGLFLLFQFFINAIIFNGGAGFILILFLADMALLSYYIRKAEGRERILEGLKRISDGELQYKIPLDGLTGEQKTMAEYINNIGSGLDAAVENSLKNERMKTELITNVSHDIKTPLTSIINYVDLLKRENFTDPKICGYLDILEEKAQRLKVLTEDVVEASKASTGNINLQMTELDFVEMVHQVIGEFEEKFQERQLTMMVHFEDEPSVIYADGQHMWRVLENIFTNVTKYAMEGTRVYAEVKKNDCKVIFSLKNISAQPLNISADELTERFIRGDVSRNTEGSGLGLSIAKSLTELQGGEFKLYLDGDLFKVTITFAAK